MPSIDGRQAKIGQVDEVCSKGSNRTRWGLVNASGRVKFWCVL